MSLFKKVSLLFFPLGIFLSAPWASAVESMQLEHVPVDASIGCERVFFKSSQNFTGTIYVLPIVIPATDEYGQTIMTTDVDPKRGSNHYILNFQLYFPNDDKAMREHTAADDAPDLPKCDFEVVKAALNANLPEAEKIHTISYMPLTSIEVSVPEFIEETFLIGQKKDFAEADLIAYQGATLNVTLPMMESEKAATLNALTRKEGLQTRVRMRFKAHKQNGALNVNLDMAQLATSFEAAAKGEAYMVQADLQAALKLALSSQNVKIQIQEGTTNSFEQIAQQIITKVLEEVKVIPEALVQDTDAKATDPDKKKISVAVVVDILAKKISSSFNVTNSTAEEVATAEVIVPLQATLNDPDIRVMRLAAGETLEPTLSEEIRQGDTFSITGSHYVLETNEYQEKTSLVTASDLRTNYVEISPIASILTNRHFTLEETVRNGVSLGVGSWDWFCILDWGSETVWKRVERTPVLVRNPQVRMDNDRATYDRFPVYATFSQVGSQRTMFRFADLMTSNSYWDGHYDIETGSIVIIAKKDLGLMALRPRFKLNENNDRADYKLELQEQCDKLDGQKRMQCYFPKCYELTQEDGSKKITNIYEMTPEQFEKSVKCASVDFQRTAVDVEKLIQEHSDIWGRVDSTTYAIRTNTKATIRQRVLFYNVKIPKHYYGLPESQNRTRDQ